MPFTYPAAASGDAATDYRAIGQQMLAGLPRLVWSFTPGTQIEGPWTQFASGSGSTIVGGAFAYGGQISTGTTAASYVTKGEKGYITNGADAPFYMAARIKLTAVAAQAKCLVGFTAQDATQWMAVGYDGQRVAANYCFSHSNGPAAIDLGVAVDTNSHVIEAVRVNGLTSARIDGGAWIGSMSSFAPFAFVAGVQATNGTDAVDRRIAVAWLGLLTQQVT